LGNFEWINRCLDLRIYIQDISMVNVKRSFIGNPYLNWPDFWYQLGICFHARHIFSKKTCQ
jgi:hypothetical protein